MNTYFYTHPSLPSLPLHFPFSFTHSLFSPYPTYHHTAVFSLLSLLFLYLPFACHSPTLTPPPSFFPSTYPSPFHPTYHPVVSFPLFFLYLHFLLSLVLPFPPTLLTPFIPPPSLLFIHLLPSPYPTYHPAVSFPLPLLLFYLHFLFSLVLPLLPLLHLSPEQLPRRSHSANRPSFNSFPALHQPK